MSESLLAVSYPPPVLQLVWPTAPWCTRLPSAPNGRWWRPSSLGRVASASTRAIPGPWITS